MYFIGIFIRRLKQLALLSCYRCYTRDDAYREVCDLGAYIQLLGKNGNVFVYLLKGPAISDLKTPLYHLSIPNSIL